MEAAWEMTRRGRAASSQRGFEDSAHGAAQLGGAEEGRQRLAGRASCSEFGRMGLRCGVELRLLFYFGVETVWCRVGRVEEERAAEAGKEIGAGWTMFRVLQ